MNFNPQTKNILIVEDNEDILEVLDIVLSAKGYRIIKAQNGKVGLETLDKLNNDPPCAIILDLMMPVMDGWEFIEQIKEKKYFPPIIISSALSASITFAEENGFDYLQKPVNFDKLLNLTQKYCGCHREFL